MPRAAQEDYIFIDVTTLGTFTDDQKKVLVEKFKLGTILDVVQRAAAGMSRCISASYADVSTTRTYTFVFGGASLQSVTAEETIEA